MTNLGKRLTALERITEASADHRHAVSEIIMAKVSEMAQRLQVTPPRPLDQQSPMERIIREALAEADEVADTQERTLVFWRGFVGRGRAYVRDRH